MITTKGKLQGAAGNFSGFSIAASFTAALPIRGAEAKPPATQSRNAELRVPAEASGNFQIAFPDAEIVGTVTLRVHYPNGAVAAVRDVPRKSLGAPVIIDVPAPTKPAATTNPNPGAGQHLKLTGMIVDASGHVRPSGTEVTIFALATAGGAPRAVLAATTDARGNFSGDYPHGTWVEAWAESGIAPGIKVAVPLAANKTLPRRALLAFPTKSVSPAPAPKPALTPASASTDCHCHGTAAVPRQPAVEELVAAPETYSADKGGRCVNFTVPNRTIEEYLYTFIVRTTDPEIKGLTLADEKTTHVPEHVLDVLGYRTADDAVKARSAAPDARPKRLRYDVLKNLGSSPTPEAIAAAVAQSATVDALEEVKAGSRQVTGRALLGPNNPLDWDEDPTFYQATTLAFGHLVHFKQVWKADGFSLGDLLYSLPLAPAQKKQIAVVDWERRESAARSEELLATEQLAADLSRDRDILEIVNTTVDETMKGASAALTGSVGKSKGSSDGGRVMGVAGGGGGAASGAIQDANRTLALNALQQLNDRTMQVANAMRSQRSTVVQSVAQGETVRAETETVANYNHCHAMTMEYFEVLRHFRVEHEVAGVGECLFVPLMMSPFDQAKTLRWRTALEPRLLARRLATGFPALDRIAHNYAGADLPSRRYADETLENLEGELTVEVTWTRPTDNDKGDFAEAAWDALKPFLAWKTGPAALFAEFLAGRASAERDRNFRDHIVPIVIEGIVQKMRIRVEGARVGGGAGQFQDADMDATLLSRPRAGVRLRVSLRARGAPPRVARADISAVTIAVPDMTTAAAQARALVRTGSLRYRTAHREDFLFHNRRIDNDLAADDDVRIDTPLNRQELRNPREEDKESSRLLLAHLNENLEYYHRALWLGMDAARRYMLLDGIIAPGTGRSVASVVENRLIAIVGNSLVMPVAPGFRLDASPDPLLNLYAPTIPFPPVRLSLPTRGVFAEAVMGECNSCEKIDDTRFWRWEESPIPGEAPAIAPISTDSRATSGPDLTAKDFAGPIINLQNAPSAPDPTGLGAALSVIGASNLFRDVTGLEGNQKNAAAALAGALGGAAAASETATRAVERAADLQMQKQLSRDGDRILEKIETAHASGALTGEQRQRATAAFVRGVTGGGAGDTTPPPSIDTAGAFSSHVSRLGKGGSLKVNLQTGEFEGTAGDPAQSGAPGLGAVAAAPSPAEERLRKELAAKLAGDPELPLLLERVDALTGKFDRTEYLKLAVDGVGGGGVSQLLATPKEIVKRNCPSSESGRQALWDAVDVLRTNHVELSIDGSTTARTPSDRIAFTFGAPPENENGSLTVEGVGVLRVRTIALGATIPMPPKKPLTFPSGTREPEPFRVAVEEMRMEPEELSDLLWSLAVAIDPSLDEKFGGPPAVAVPADLFDLRIDINPGCDLHKGFGLGLGFGENPSPVGGTILLGSVPRFPLGSPIPKGSGSKVSGKPLVAFVGSSTFYEMATASGEFFAPAISDILARATAAGPSLGLVMTGLEALDPVRKTLIAKSEQGGVVLGDFAGLSRIKSADVSVTVFVCDFPAPEIDRATLTLEQLASLDRELEQLVEIRQMVSTGRDRFVEMWRSGADIVPNIIRPKTSQQEMIDAIKGTIDFMKEGQLCVFNYLGHTYQWAFDGRLLGLELADGNFFGPAELLDIADHAGKKKIHFLAVMETCQSGGYLNALAQAQIAQLKGSGKATGRLESIIRVQAGLEDIFSSLWRLRTDFLPPVQDQHAEWAMRGLAAATDAAIPSLPAIDPALATPSQTAAATNEIRAQLEKAVKDIRASRNALKSVAGDLGVLLTEAFNSPLLKGEIALPVDHGREGQADEIAGPVADKLTAAFQMEFKTLLAISP